MANATLRYQTDIRCRYTLLHLDTQLRSVVVICGYTVSL
jgi:hypothetical protein